MRAFRTLGRQLTSAAAALAIFAECEAPAAAQTAGERLEAFVRLTQFASPYGTPVQFPEQWCYWSKVDARSVWYFTDVSTGKVAGAHVRNAFAVPFVNEVYSLPRLGAMLVGYAVGGSTPTGPLVPTSIDPPSVDCPLGALLLARSPFPIVKLAEKLDLQTAIDPAPEYHYWELFGKHRRVRLILSVPALFQVDASEVHGRIILGFSLEED